MFLEPSVCSETCYYNVNERFIIGITKSAAGFIPEKFQSISRGSEILFPEAMRRVFYVIF